MNSKICLLKYVSFKRCYYNVETSCMSMQIVSRCGRPSSSSLPANKVSEFSTHGRLNDLRDIQSLPGLQVQIGTVMRTVVTSLGFFQRLPNVICSHENFLADSELTCWNGTDFAEWVYRTIFIPSHFLANGSCWIGHAYKWLHWFVSCLTSTVMDEST
jgi:Glypican